MTETTKKISVIIPLFNEEESIDELIKEINQVLNDNQINDSEIIIVDDGSTDSSWVKINNISQKNKNVRGFRLRKNFGKSIALNVGFKEVKNDLVITLDADLQDDPKSIPDFLKALEKSDMVSGWKKERKDPFSKTIPSKLFNFVTRSISKVNLKDFNCGFKGYKKEVLKNLNLYGELHRYIPLLVNDLGYKISEIDIIHRPRKHGKSKFGYERYYRGFIDLISVTASTTFLRRPGHLFGGFGFSAGIIGFLILLYLLGIWILNNVYSFSLGAIGTRPLLFLGILLVIISIQLISLGIIAELLIRTRKAAETTVYIKDKTE